MRKLAILTFQTLDGVMQAPSDPEEDRSGGFTRGGWGKECWDDVMQQVSREAMGEPYDLLLGRKTYDIFSSSFASADIDNPVAKKLNSATKYVVTTGSDELQWKNSVKISGDIVAEISRLKSEEGKLIQVHGSWQLIQTLLSHDLIDELRLWTFPVIVGAGKRLFSEGTSTRKYQLVRSAPCSSGAQMSFYQPC